MATVELLDNSEVQPWGWTFLLSKSSTHSFFINSYFTWVELLDNHKVQPMLLGWTLLLSKSSTVLVLSKVIKQYLYGNVLMFRQQLKQNFDWHCVDHVDV